MDQRTDPPEAERQPFDPNQPWTWPDGMRKFLKSLLPMTDEVVDAYRAWLEECERELRMKVLAGQLSTTPAPGDTKSPKARKPPPRAPQVVSPPWVAEVMKDGGLTVGEFARRINKSEKTVRRMIDDGRLHAVKQGDAESAHYLIPRSSAEAYLARLEG